VAASLENMVDSGASENISADAAAGTNRSIIARRALANGGGRLSRRDRGGARWDPDETRLRIL
jgi:hypothetical protein